MSRKSDETKLCIAFTKHVDQYFPQGPLLLYTHIANEGRSPQQGALLKKMGVNAGWFDYIFLHRQSVNDEWKVSKLEAKIGKNGLSDSQKIFSSMYGVGGHERGAIFRTVEQGHYQLMEWGINPVVKCHYFGEPNLMTWENKVKAAYDWQKP